MVAGACVYSVTRMSRGRSGVHGALNDAEVELEVIPPNVKFGRLRFRLGAHLRTVRG